MSANNTLEVDVLAMVAKGTDPAWRAAATGYLALFTADPTETGSLVAECADTGYDRLAITKATFWTGTNPLTNAALAIWPALEQTLGNLTHWALVSSASGATDYMLSGTLTNFVPNLPGITPTAQIGSLQLNAD
jgi:hypothetical protein